MDIQLRTKDVEMTPALRRFLHRRIQPLLGRFEGRIEWVRVTLVDVNGPRGGEDIQCRVLVSVTGGQVVVESMGDDPFTAVGRAASRLRLSLSNRFGKLQNRRRSARRLQPS